MDGFDLAPLLTPDGWRLLESLPPYDPGQALALGESLRREGHSPALVAAALTQQRLRQRAAAKFGPFAARMLFTPDALEQATRLAVSAHHASRFARAGSRCVADLGCGIGGDALALASLCPQVLAVERDEPTAALATVNLSPFPNAEVRCADALEVDLAAEGVDAVFADPARRSGGRRITDPECWSPPLGQVLGLREQVEALGVKVAPGIDHALLPADAHVQWVSVDGQVVEAGIWCGPLAPEGSGRSALVLHSGADGEPVAHTLTDPDCDNPATPPVQLDPVAGPEDLEGIIHEPDGAAIRAGLVAHLAGRLGAVPVGHRIAYLTGSTPAGAEAAPFVRSWRLVEVLPLHLKALRSRVRNRGIGRLEIHARGVDVSPEALRASLRPQGDAGEVWLLTRIGPRGDGGRGRSPRGAVLVVEPAAPARPPESCSAHPSS
ncbi:Methyltransferase domain-containing protein [Actinomyces ruminicola]|uniref:Methyltransferase domain-containing protein n=1 Tax=Actinomyces ruminicola TaxID=332524 RepID=A0A1H0A395_9ACTO|nr:class I SAM-dependent methyltransferase [Actinomyces ruminicola]SDN27857.1 Methyltransferase domain-containing protein [Actinomyces ruminicola]